MRHRTNLQLLIIAFLTIFCYIKVYFQKKGDCFNMKKKVACTAIAIGLISIIIVQLLNNRTFPEKEEILEFITSFHYAEINKDYKFIESHIYLNENLDISRDEYLNLSFNSYDEKQITNIEILDIDKIENNLYKFKFNIWELEGASTKETVGTYTNYVINLDNNLYIVRSTEQLPEEFINLIYNSK